MSVAHTDPFWVGRLSAAIAANLPRIKREPEHARAELKRTLQEFMRSPVADPRLKETLRKLGKEKP